MKSNIETITPARAEQLLRLNTNNRPADPRKVQQYANAMLAGEWIDNGDTITISSDNVMMNGQHRLLAVIRSGHSITSPVVTELPPAAFATYDRHYGRTVGAIFIMDKVPNGEAAAAISAKLVLWEKNKACLMKGGGHGIERPTPAALLRYHGEHRAEITAAIAKGQSFAKSASFMSRNDWGFLAVVLERTGAGHEADAFLQSFAAGTNMRDGDVTLRVRNILFNGMKAGAGLALTAKLNYIIYAWNCVRTGRPRQRGQPAYSAKMLIAV